MVKATHTGDAGRLLYATTRTAPEHHVAASWLKVVLSGSGVMAIQPGPRHAEILEQVVSQAGATGALMSAAVLAAMAIENGATLASTDRDFNRFKGLRWINPLELS